MIEILQEIYLTVKHNKLRTSLTGFAVAWGIFMLIVLLGSGNGLINAFRSNGAAFGTNLLTLYPGSTSLPYHGYAKNRPIRLQHPDIDNLQKEFSNHITAASPAIDVSSQYISFGKEYVNSGILGISPAYFESDLPIHCKSGRLINQKDMEEKRKVIVISEKAARTLFESQHVEPLGKYLRINDLLFKVVGVYSGISSGYFESCYVPASTADRIYSKGGNYDRIVTATKDLGTEQKNIDFENSIRGLMARTHEYDPADENALFMWNKSYNNVRSNQVDRVLTIAIWVIGIFTLLSGIVGVSNIMLISVKERTREFGIRKALGAKPRSILWLIVAESIIITAFFGYIGLVAGVGVTEWMDATLGQKVVEMGGFKAALFKDPTVNMRIAIEATLTLIIAGTLSGLFPAIKAVRIRPIEALRAN